MTTIGGQATDGACGEALKRREMARKLQSGSTHVPQGRARVIHARLTATEMAAASHAARRAGVTLSAFIRSLVMEGAGVEPFLSEEEREVFASLHRELRLIGVNLNGLTRAVHSGRIVESKVAALLDDLRSAVVAVGGELARMSRRIGQKRRSDG